ncbi:helix-turn-helix domain-containing protein [Leuconostoc suionicum]|uniref:helix-turn-helix domain-containing protein n=1 Tax=Leuconostoc suionicum TaxID=1511761 RepID=UPI001B8CD875|nr:helix-turn-helix transcriptional regulator [Leuconostoc suionicum]MBS1007768.1 helix-turn-helix transcriptional regulator [Leuconostoc suionicum]
MSHYYGNKIKNILSEKNKTIYWLSKESGIPYSTINPIIRNERSPMFETIIKIADALDIKTDELR